MTRRICTKPFEWLELFNQPEGEVFLCCSGWLPVSAGNLNEADAKAIWQGERASEIRQSVIDGSFKYCSAEFCPYVAEPFAPESPIKDVDEFELQEYQLAVNQPELYLAGPKTINCAYDRSCNLACPSCRKDIIQATKSDREKYAQLIGGVLDVFADDLGTLYVTGSGDPFASRHLWELLTSDIGLKYPELKFRLHTNAILFTEERWAKLSQIHDRIELIEISMDGGRQASYEINRYPAKWDVFVERMQFVASIRRQFPALVLKINHVVQANNWRDMKALIQHARDWGVDIVKFSKINNWGTYTPSEYRKVCVQDPLHDDHEDFLAFLDDPIFDDPMIMIDDFGSCDELLIATDCR